MPIPSPTPGDPDRLAVTLEKCRLPENQALENLDQRRMVLEALGIPTLFAHPTGHPLLPIRTDELLNCWLWCYFYRGPDWENLQALMGKEDCTLTEILSTYEFNAVDLQDQRYLSLLTTDHYVDLQFSLKITGPTTEYVYKPRIPREVHQMLRTRTLDLFAEEINRFAAQLGDWFDEVKTEAGDWLKSRYEGVDPVRSKFVAWFLSNKGALAFKIGIETVPPNWAIASYFFGERSLEDVYDPLVQEYCQYRLDQLESQANSLHAAQVTHQPNSGKKTPEAESSNQGVASVEMPLAVPTLTSLFTTPERYAQAIGLLRSCNVPILNESHEWIGGKGSKSILVGWIEALEIKGYLRKVDDRTVLAQCLMEAFPNLTMDTKDASLRRKFTSTSYRHYAD